MKITKESLIIYYRKIIQNKNNPELVRNNAREKLLKLLDKNERQN